MFITVGPPTLIQYNVSSAWHGSRTRVLTIVSTLFHRSSGSAGNSSIALMKAKPAFGVNVTLSSLEPSDGRKNSLTTQARGGEKEGRSRYLPRVEMMNHDEDRSTDWDVKNGKKWKRRTSTILLLPGAAEVGYTRW